MRRFFILFSFLLICSTVAGYAQSSTPEPAKQILDKAVQQAQSSHRNVFLIFHASWCSWCKKLEAALSNPDVKKVIDQNYVVTEIDVMERGTKKDSLENPGGEEILKKFGGEKSGLPFYVVLSGKGKKIGDSNMMPGQTNIGYPGAKEELAAFDTLLKQTAPRMTEQQRAGVMKHFTM